MFYFVIIRTLPLYSTAIELPRPTQQSKQTHKSRGSLFYILDNETLKRQWLFLAICNSH